MNKVAIIIPNGGMDEVTQTLRDHIYRNVKCDWDTFIVNNPGGVIGYYTKKFASGLGMTNAILTGMNMVDVVSRSEILGNYFAYWICTTSIEFLTEEDYLTPLLNYMVEHPKVAMISPSTNDMAWDCMRQQPGGGFRKVWGVDNVCVLIRKDWFDGIGRYDPELVMGWGPTVEASWQARRDGMEIIVYDGLRFKWNDGIAHTMGRRTLTRAEHNNAAAEEMRRVFQKKYGDGWENKLHFEFLDGL
jgi:hypothetical protein